MANISGLSQAQNDRIRKLAARLRDELCGGSITELAARLGRGANGEYAVITPAGLSGFMSGRQGTSYAVAKALEELAGLPRYSVIDGEEPRARKRRAS